MLPEEHNHAVQYDADAAYDDWRDQQDDEAMYQWLDENPDQGVDGYTEYGLLTDR